MSERRYSVALGPVARGMDRRRETRLAAYLLDCALGQQVDVLVVWVVVVLGGLGQHAGGRLSAGQAQRPGRLQAEGQKARYMVPQTVQDRLAGP